MSKSNYCRNKMNKSGASRINLKFFNLTLFILMVVFGGFYLFNINALTVQGFVLQDLKLEVEHLADEKMEIEESINEAQSFYALNSRVDNLNMIEASDIEYIKVSQQAVAKK